MDSRPSHKIQAALDLDISRCAREDLKVPLGVLQQSLFKKLRPIDHTQQDLEALRLFKFYNDRNTEPHFTPSEGLLAHLQESFRALEHGVNSDASNFRFADSKIIAGCRFGPGSSVGVRGNTHIHKAGMSPLTFRSAYGLALYKESTLLSSIAKIGEEHRQKVYGCERVRHSNLRFVPKDSLVSRVIVVEPSVDMFIQKGIGKIIEDALRHRFGIDIRYQPDVNRLLAKQGSVNGAWSTIDLSSASDTISLQLLEAVCKHAPMLHELILEFRAPSVVCNGEVIDLHMVSTMGNGFTFPLQTYLFASVVEYVSKESRVNVFGDDIVCRTEHFDQLVDNLTSLGFVVNRKKSFKEGNFRESCGGDYHSGRDVRGVYCKNLETARDFYVLWNRLQKWCERESTYLFNTFEAILECLDPSMLHAVPDHEDDSAGLKGFAPPELSRTSRKGQEKRGLPAVCWEYSFVGPATKFLTRQRYEKCGHLATWLEAMLLGYASDRVSVRGQTRDVVSCRFTTVWRAPHSERLCIEAYNEMLRSLPRG